MPQASHPGEKGFYKHAHITMMNRDALKRQVKALLARTGFYVAEVPNTRGLCFDLVARRDQTLLLLKVLANVDALPKEAARELRVLASQLDAIPGILGLRGGGGELETGVIYSRFGVPILALGTLEDYLLEGVPPFAFSAPGGLYVQLDREVLRRNRAQGKTLGQLAEVAHVSRRTIQMYLEGMSATVEVALRLEEFLGQTVIKPLNPMSFVERPAEVPPDSLEGLEEFPRRMLGLLQALGFETVPVQRAPFDAFTRGEGLLLLTGLERLERDLRDKAEAVARISRVVERTPVVIVGKRSRRGQRWGVAVVEARELQDFEDPEELVEAVEDRRG